MSSLTMPDAAKAGAAPDFAASGAAPLDAPADGSAAEGSRASVGGRIAVLRLVLICGILFIHIPVPPLFESPFDGPFAFVRAFVCDALFRATVPTLTGISGFLLFRSALDRRPGALLAKKSRTVLLPLVVWNLPLLPILYVLEAYDLAGHRFTVPAYPFDPWAWLDATLGLTGQPANFPLYFLRDLYVVSLMAPLFGVLIRRLPWLGLALVSAVFFFDLDGPLVLRDTMAVNFYLGGMAAVGGWNLRRLDPVWPLCVLLLALSCVVIVVWPVHDLRAFTLVAPVLVWPAFAPLARTRLGAALAAASPASFAIFVTHAPILLALWFPFERWGHPAWYPAFWLLAPSLAIATAVGLRRAGYRLSPGLAALALGAR